MSLSNVPDAVVDKVPTQEQFNKNPKGAISYIFMLLFLGYFVYKEYKGKDDCGEKIATIERSSIQKDLLIQRLTDRVDKLECALDVQNGVNAKVEDATNKANGGATK